MRTVLRVHTKCARYFLTRLELCERLPERKKNIEAHVNEEIGCSSRSWEVAERAAQTLSTGWARRTRSPRANPFRAGFPVGARSDKLQTSANVGRQRTPSCAKVVRRSARVSKGRLCRGQICVATQILVRKKFALLCTSVKCFWTRQ